MISSSGLCLSPGYCAAVASHRSLGYRLGNRDPNDERDKPIKSCDWGGFATLEREKEREREREREKERERESTCLMKPLDVHEQD